MSSTRKLFESFKSNLNEAKGRKLSFGEYQDLYDPYCNLTDDELRDMYERDKDKLYTDEEIEQIKSEVEGFFDMEESALNEDDSFYNELEVTNYRPTGQTEGALANMTIKSKFGELNVNLLNIDGEYRIVTPNMFRTKEEEELINNLVNEYGMQGLTDFAADYYYKQTHMNESALTENESNIKLLVNIYEPIEYIKNNCESLVDKSYEEFNNEVVNPLDLSVSIYGEKVYGQVKSIDELKRKLVKKVNALSNKYKEEDKKLKFVIFYNYFIYDNGIKSAEFSVGLGEKESNASRYFKTKYYDSSEYDYFYASIVCENKELNNDLEKRVATINAKRANTVNTNKDIANESNLDKVRKDSIEKGLLSEDYNPLNIKLFMNTWGNYNVNGADVDSIGGGWMNIEQVKDFLEKHSDEEPFINDVDGWTPFEINEYSNVEQVIEWLEAYENLSANEQEAFAAIMEDQNDDFESAMNILESGEYVFFAGVDNEEDLGRAWVDMVGGIEGVSNPENYVDEDAYKESWRDAAEEDIRNENPDIDEDSYEFEDLVQNWLDTVALEELQNEIDSGADLSEYFDYEALGNDLYSDGFYFATTGAIQTL